MKYSITALLGFLVSCTGLSISDDDFGKVGQNRLAIASSISQTNFDAGVSDDLDVTEFGLQVNYGHIVDEGPLEYGVRFGFNYAKADLGEEYADELSLAVVGNLRYYLEMEKKVRPFLQVFAGPTSVRVSSSGSGSESYSSILIGGSVGASLFVAQNISFEVDLTLQRWEFDNVESTDVSANLGIAIHW